MSARFCDDCGMRKAVCREHGCQNAPAMPRVIVVHPTTPTGPGPFRKVSRAELAAMYPDDLEDKLRASVALNDRKRMAHEDLYAAIAAKRTELEDTLRLARAKRNDLNLTIHETLEALKALPTAPRTKAVKPVPPEPDTDGGYLAGGE